MGARAITRDQQDASGDFVAIDVETANPDMASICQIGLVHCRNGVLGEEWSTYVDPQDYFDPINVSIHGIDERKIKSSPTFAQLSDKLRSRLQGKVAVCHTHFDRTAIHQAALRHGVATPESTWLDSARVARRAWKQCAWKGYGLRDVCSLIGYSFAHHDALEDAKAAAHILLAASSATGLDIAGWLKRVQQPIDPTPRPSYHSERIERDGNPEGDLYGEVLVFTGSLQITRDEAAKKAAAIGCQVASVVTRKTTILVVGDQDIRKLAGKKKSSKHLRAEELIGKGVPMCILQESDFLEVVRTHGELA